MYDGDMITSVGVFIINGKGTIFVWDVVIQKRQISEQ